MTNIPSTNADISCVPPEILSEIFVCCLQAEDSPSRNIQPLLLGSVCRLWRTLALTTPALWASLDITCDLEADILRPPLPVIQTYLQRSGTHPLSIVLNTTNPYGDSPLFTAALTALMASRQQWNDVYIKLAGMTQEILDFITEGDAPLLQSIRCEVFGIRIPEFPIPLRMLHGCPRLNSFQWMSFGSRLLQPLGDTQLTSLSLGATLPTAECITILRFSPHLSSAKLKTLSFADSSTTPHLTHPTLSTLNISGAQVATLLAALTLPALLDLDLVARGKINSLPTWGDTLSVFLGRSKPMLRRLSLSSTQTPLEPTLLRILTLTPHLHTLSLVGPSGFATPFTPALIHALHPTPSPGAPLCPRLQGLELVWIAGCSDGLCGAMLRARWGAQAHTNGVARLERVNIAFKGGVHDRDEADMAELRAEGMQGVIRQQALGGSTVTV